MVVVTELDTLYSLPSPAVLTRTLIMDSSAAPPPTTPPPAAPCSMSAAPPSFLSDEAEVARVPRLLERRGIEDCATAMSSSVAGVMAPRDGSICNRDSGKAVTVLALDPGMKWWKCEIYALNHNASNSCGNRSFEA